MFSSDRVNSTVNVRQQIITGQVITDTHLLQFGALVGESNAKLALSQTHSPGPLGHPDCCMFGDTDDLKGWKHGWELVVHESLPGLSFWAYKRRLRKGLYLYKNKTGAVAVINV